MADHIIYPVDNSGLVGNGAGADLACDDDALALAKGALKKGAAAEVWEGTRLAGRVSASSTTYHNHLLNGLPDDEMQHLQAILRPVKLVLEQVLHEVGSPIDNVFFIESGLVSLVADTADGGTVEVGMTGREGLVGLPALLHPRPSSIHRAIVQLPGDAFGARATEFSQALKRLPVLKDRCLRCVQCMMAQTAQAAACNARHELPERLARWLLMAHDRSDGDDLPMTQEFLSYMLGVRRAGVSVVASALQANRVIRQSRGKLTILDRGGLAAQSCSCYRLIEDSRHKIMCN